MLNLREEIKIKVLSSDEDIVAVFEIRSLKNEKQTVDRKITLKNLGWFVPHAYLVNVQDGFYLIERDKKNWKPFKITYKDIIGVPIKNRGWGNSSLIFDTEKWGEITLNFDDYIFDSASSIIEKNCKIPDDLSRNPDKSNSISGKSREKNNSDPEIISNPSHQITKTAKWDPKIITDCPETIAEAGANVTNKDDIILAVLTVSDLEIENRTSGKEITFNNPIVWQKSYFILVQGGFYFINEDHNVWKKYTICYQDVVGPLIKESEIVRSQVIVHTNNCGKISFKVVTDLFDKITNILMHEGAIATNDNTERIIKVFSGKFFAGTGSFPWFIITENKIIVTNNFYYREKTPGKEFSYKGGFSKGFAEIASGCASSATLFPGNKELVIKKLDVIIEKQNIDKISLIANYVQNYTILLESKKFKEYRITFSCDYGEYENIKRNLQEFYPDLVILNGIQKTDTAQLIFNGSCYNEQLLREVQRSTIGQDERIRAFLEIKYTEKPPEVYQIPVPLNYKNGLLDLDYFFVTDKRIIAILMNRLSRGVYSIPLFDIKSVRVIPETFNLSFKCKNAKKFTIAMEGIHNLSYPVKNLFETKLVSHHNIN